MNKSEIADRCGREILNFLCAIDWSQSTPPWREKRISEFVERAIAESRGQRTLSDLDWETICAERDHWRAIAVKAVPGCNAPFGEEVVEKNGQPRDGDICADCKKPFGDYIHNLPEGRDDMNNHEFVPVGDGEPSSAPPEQFPDSIKLLINLRREILSLLPLYRCGDLRGENVGTDFGSMLVRIDTFLEPYDILESGAAQEVSPPSPVSAESPNVTKRVIELLHADLEKARGDTRELKAALKEMFEYPTIWSKFPESVIRRLSDAMQE